MSDTPADRADEHRRLSVALTAAFARFEDLLAQAGDTETPIKNSTWTVSDLAAHVAAGLEAYARYLNGDAVAAFDVSDVAGGSLAASNAEQLVRERERTISVLGRRAADAFADVIARSDELQLDDLVPWHGRREPLRSVLAALLGELLMHGRDLAISLGVDWPISKDEAIVLLDNIAPLLPVLVDKEATSTLVADIRVIVRGGQPIHLSFDHGSVTVGGNPRRFDATVSADPVAFLLVAYGRRSQWRAIAGGGLIAWGRRPWLALKLTSYLAAP